MRPTRLTLAIAGAVVAGGAVLTLLLGSGAAFAASPTPTALPAASSGTNQVHAGSPFGRTETVSDASVVAKAHSVDPQKVIDALVADGLDELAAQVKAGTLTQAQADAQKAAVTQRATDQVNGTFRGGAGGPGGTGCPSGATH